MISTHAHLKQVRLFLLNNSTIGKSFETYGKLKGGEKLVFAFVLQGFLSTVGSIRTGTMFHVSLLPDAQHLLLVSVLLETLFLEYNLQHCVSFRCTAK